MMADSRFRRKMAVGLYTRLIVYLIADADVEAFQWIDWTCSCQLGPEVVSDVK